MVVEVALPGRIGEASPFIGIRLTPAVGSSASSTHYLAELSKTCSLKRLSDALCETLALPPHGILLISQGRTLNLDHTVEENQIMLPRPAAREMGAKVELLYDVAEKVIEGIQAIEVKKAEIQKLFEEVSAEFQAAQQAVNSVSKRAVDEMCDLFKPPEGVKLAMEAATLIVRPEVGNEVTWDMVRKHVRDRTFIPSILEYDTENMKDSTRHMLEKDYLGSKNWNVKAIARASSFAGPIALWVQAQLKVAHLLHQTEPMRKQLQSMEEQANTNQRELETQQAQECIQVVVSSALTGQFVKEIYLPPTSFIRGVKNHLLEQGLPICQQLLHNEQVLDENCSLEDILVQGSPQLELQLLILPVQRVQLARARGRSSLGNLLFRGPVAGLIRESDEWLGIEMDDPFGDSDGVYDGIRYFTCKRNSALFVKPDEVRYVEDTRNLQETERVQLAARSGKLCFRGATDFAAGEWVGVELDDPVGKNSGVVKGIRYFWCAQHHGIFVRPSMIQFA